MKNMRAIKARIVSVENTRQITKSMKTVASSKLRKTQQAMAPMNAFAARCRLVMEGLPAASTAQCPLFESREAAKTCFVLIIGNRGLCGGYNSSLVRYAQTLAAETEGECFFAVCGSWGKEALPSALADIRMSFPVSDVPSFEEADAAAKYLEELFLSGKADRVVLVYQQFRSILAQQPCTRTLLPLQAEAKNAEREFIFEPDAEGILASLSEMYMKNSLYSALLEARTSEHAARMTAMTSASDNTEEIIAELRLELNHARQAAITTEVSEITGGAEALKNAGA